MESESELETRCSYLLQQWERCRLRLLKSSEPISLSTADCGTWTTQCCFFFFFWIQNGHGSLFSLSLCILTGCWFQACFPWHLELFFSFSVHLCWTAGALHCWRCWLSWMLLKKDMVFSLLSFRKLSRFTAAYSGKMVLKLPSVVQFLLFTSLRTRKRIQNFLVTIFRERKVGGGERSQKFLLEEKGLILNEEGSLTNEKREQDRNTEKEEKPRKGAQRHPKRVQSF